MKYLRLALTLLALTPAAMRADNADSSDQDSEEQQKPPTEIPDFNNLDEYVYVPKSTLNFGWRVIGGTKVKFTGSASILSYSPVPDLTNQNVSRTYADGYVYSDTRTVVSENGDGTAVSFPITPDGKTNTWTYTNTSQVLPSGFIQFHIYTADTTASEFNASGKTNTGLEVSVAHDYKDFGKHWSLKLFGGFSVNDISAYSMGTLNAVLNTTTDTYDLYGVTPPPGDPRDPLQFGRRHRRYAGRVRCERQSGIRRQRQPDHRVGGHEYPNFQLSAQPAHFERPDHGDQYL